VTKGSFRTAPNGIRHLADQRQSQADSKRTYGSQIPDISSVGATGVKSYVDNIASTTVAN